jgi:hypothetical protein
MQSGLQSQLGLVEKKENFATFQEINSWVFRQFKISLVAHNLGYFISGRVCTTYGRFCRNAYSRTGCLNLRILFQTTAYDSLSHYEFWIFVQKCVFWQWFIQVYWFLSADDFENLPYLQVQGHGFSRQLVLTNSLIFLWQQTVQHLPLFQFTVSWGPCI